jgi:hypothetical protein
MTRDVGVVCLGGLGLGLVMDGALVGSLGTLILAAGHVLGVMVVDLAAATAVN